MKTPVNKPSRVKMIEHLIEYMIGLIDKTLADTLLDDRWHTKWSLTKAQYETLYKYSIPMIKKVFRCNRAKAVITFNWFYDVFGLKIRG